MPIIKERKESQTGRSVGVTQEGLIIYVRAVVKTRSKRFTFHHPKRNTDQTRSTALSLPQPAPTRRYRAPLCRCLCSSVGRSLTPEVPLRVRRASEKSGGTFLPPTQTFPVGGEPVTPVPRKKRLLEALMTMRQRFRRSTSPTAPLTLPSETAVVVPTGEGRRAINSV